MKIDCGYTTAFSIVTENVQDELWLDGFIKDLYKEAKKKKSIKFLDSALIVNLDDHCVKTKDDGTEYPVGFCTISEYAKTNGWGLLSFTKGLEFDIDF